MPDLLLQFRKRHLPIWHRQRQQLKIWSGAALRGQQR
jgi:hypothetical protein